LRELGRDAGAKMNQRLRSRLRFCSIVSLPRSVSQQVTTNFATWLAPCRSYRAAPNAPPTDDGVGGVLDKVARAPVLDADALAA